MGWSTPINSRTSVNRAGKILTEDNPNLKDLMWAFSIIENWRSSHGYPLNTFQATLRKKLKGIDEDSFVAQRLKRIPSITSKLKRFKSMKLARMQDIGGLRAVVSTLEHARILESNYKESRFEHSLISNKDYIANPKESGYRGIHLVYRYKSKIAPEYNGLCIELQIRTKLQHSWATAVETMGTFLNYGLKSSEGPEEWLKFFALAGSAFAHIEQTASTPGYENLSAMQTYRETIEESQRLNIYDRLRAFSIAAESIHTGKSKGQYHLIELDLKKKTVTISSYSKHSLEEANNDYIKLERRVSMGEDIQAVLVSAGPVENLQRAYPNYFLDSREFIRQLELIKNNML